MNAPSEYQLVELLKCKQEHSKARHLRRAKMQRNEECEAYLEEAAINTCDPETVVNELDSIKEIQDSYKKCALHAHKTHINHTHDMCIKPA